MASEETLKKMVHAIMEKRKTLGIPDWGMVPVEQVLDKLNQLPADTKKDEPKNLAENPEPHQNDHLQQGTGYARDRRSRFVPHED